MSYVFKKDENAALGAGASGITTGVYKLRVLGVVYNPDSKGNPRADFYFQDENGKRAVIFGMCIAEKWLTGSDNLDYKKWQEFAQVCGMETGTIAAQEVQTSKDKKETKDVFVECTGKVINVAIQETFDIISQGKKAGQESNDKNIYRTFFEDGKSIAENATNTAAKSIEAIRSSLKPYETKAYKAKKIGGGATSEDVELHDEDITSDEDLI